jgi:transposase
MCVASFNKNPSTTTINRILGDFNFSIKRVSIQPEQRNDSLAIERRAQYANHFMEVLSTIPDGNILYLDEVGFCVSMRTRRGRSIRGSPAVITVPSIRTRNISVCACVSKLTTVSYMVSHRPFNTESFVDYMKLLCDKLERDGKTGVKIVADNVAFHKSLAVKSLIESKGHSMLFLPPYSPFLNMIENLFSKWKEAVCRSSPKNEVELFGAIDSASGLITDEDCQNCFRNMLSFIRRCINREPILDS